MPVTRFLQSWRVALLVGSWLAFAGAALLLAIDYPAQDLHHPAVVATARYAVGAWFGACVVILRHGLTPFARLVWALGAAMHVVHVVFAFALAHGWSHGHAFRRVEHVGGYGEGIFVSHAFALVWVADAAWWCVNPCGYARRPSWVRVAVHGFLAFVVFNSTVVFGPPATQVVSAVLFGVLSVLLWWRPLTSSPRAAGS